MAEPPESQLQSSIREDSVNGQNFLPVPPYMIFPRTVGGFRIYIKQGGRYVLYATEQEQFTERHRRELPEYGIKEVYIQTDQKPDYDRYVEENLGRILFSDDPPLEERAAIFYNASLGVIRELFQRSQVQDILSRTQLDRVLRLVQQTMKFMASEEALKRLAALIRHDYKTYSHSLHVFVFSAAVLQTYDFEEKDLIEVGLGAILHDLGKSGIPQEILRKCGPLTSAEFEVVKTHPLRGAALCSHLPLSNQTTNCILFHHERMDGLGYPAGLRKDVLPLAVRVISVCNVYDSLTSSRPYAQQLTPFQALSLMRQDMEGAFDLEVFKRLIMVLSGAAVI